jgi:hypothetical protein
LGCPIIFRAPALAEPSHRRCPDDDGRLHYEEGNNDRRDTVKLDADRVAHEAHNDGAGCQGIHAGVISVGDQAEAARLTSDVHLVLGGVIRNQRGNETAAYRQWEIRDGRAADSRDLTKDTDGGPEDQAADDEPNDVLDDHQVYPALAA